MSMARKNNPVFDRDYWERVACGAEKFGDGWLVRYASERARKSQVVTAT
jgi:hypothetical protein